MTNRKRGKSCIGETKCDVKHWLEVSHITPEKMLGHESSIAEIIWVVGEL